MLAAQDVSVVYKLSNPKQRLLALDRVSVAVGKQEFVSIVGASGCGKTTFLNAVGGLVRIAEGSIHCDGLPVKGPGPNRAIVFQQSRLLPWRTVLRNVSYGLELQRKLPQKQIDERAMQFIELVGLKGFEHRYPSELSGGMQQRANVARALTLEPKVLLMDEPFGALDAQTREFMQFELTKICARANTTTLFITHDIAEAVYLSDKVYVFSARPGRVRAVVPISLPRPRPLSVKRDARFLELVDRIWSLIEDEGRRSGLIAVGD